MPRWDTWKRRSGRRWFRSCKEGQETGHRSQNRTYVRFDFDPWSEF
jgi:hypothetical protein